MGDTHIHLSAWRGLPTLQPSEPDTESYLLQDLVSLMVMCGTAAVGPLTILFGERKLLVDCLLNPIL